MKSKKLNLNDLQVKSFVTNMNGETSETVKGGFEPHVTCPLCPSVNGPGCTFGECFTVGQYCSDVQIC